MSAAPVLITERFLSDAGGWQALKEARGIHSAGRVLEATYEPPLLEGRIREGQGELRSGLRILSQSKVETLCTCRTARRDGMICAHALAIGLEWLKPSPKAAAPAPVAVAQPQAAEAETPKVVEGPRLGATGEPLELSIVLPGKFAATWEKGQVTIGAEVAVNGRRVLLSALEANREYACSPEDLRVIEQLRTLAGGALPGVAVLDRVGFLDLLPTLAAHPRVTFAKATPVTVGTTPFRATAELPPQALLLASGTQAWLLEGAVFRPLTIEAPSGRGVSAATLPVAESPRFSLALEGSLNHLTASLDALYGDRSFTVEATPPRVAGSIPRHHATERAALERLQRVGFMGPDRNGQLVLKGEADILGFFASELPRLQKEWASVTIGERFAYVTKDIERIEPKFEIRTSGENWFDLQVELSTPGGERFSASEIQRLLQSGQSATRLKNRKIAVFDTALLNEFQEALTDCSPQQRQPGSYRIARAHAPFLSELAQEQGTSVTSDSTWQKWTHPTACASSVNDPALQPWKAILRPYQMEGVVWLNNLRYNGLNGLLADEMGLGKTVQTLAFLGALTGKKLVVCPSTLVFNWEREAQRFTPSQRVLVIQGPARHALFGEPFRQADLVITSYALLRRDFEQYEGAQFAAVVLDEAQHIKNPDSQNAQSASALKAQFRLALTGTPVENSPTDLWSLMHFLMPGYLGIKRDFRERYEDEIRKEPGGAAHQRLVKRLRPYILR